MRNFFEQNEIIELSLEEFRSISDRTETFENKQLFFELIKNVRRKYCHETVSVELWKIKALS